MCTSQSSFPWPLESSLHSIFTLVCDCSQLLYQHVILSQSLIEWMTSTWVADNFAGCVDTLLNHAWWDHTWLQLSPSTSSLVYCFIRIQLAFKFLLNHIIFKINLLVIQYSRSRVRSDHEWNVSGSPLCKVCAAIK